MSADALTDARSRFASAIAESGDPARVRVTVLGRQGRPRVEIAEQALAAALRLGGSVRGAWKVLEAAGIPCALATVQTRVADLGWTPAPRAPKPAKSTRGRGRPRGSKNRPRDRK